MQQCKKSGPCKCKECKDMVKATYNQDSTIDKPTVGASVPSRFINHGRTTFLPDSRNVSTVNPEPIKMTATAETVQKAVKPAQEIQTMMPTTVEENKAALPANMKTAGTSSGSSWLIYAAVAAATGWLLFGNTK